MVTVSCGSRDGTGTLWEEAGTAMKKSANATAETEIRMRLFSDGAPSRYRAGATVTTGRFSYDRKNTSVSPGLFRLRSMRPELAKGTQTRQQMRQLIQ